jgi:hypothetical protein
MYNRRGGEEKQKKKKREREKKKKKKKAHDNAQNMTKRQYTDEIEQRET